MGGGVGLRGGQDECERRIEFFVKIQNKIIFWGGEGVGLGMGGQGRFEQRSEVFVKIQNKNGWGGQVGLRGGSGWM